jgi:hypothetical protein
MRIDSFPNEARPLVQKYVCFAPCSPTFCAEHCERVARNLMSQTTIRSSSQAYAFEDRIQL